jgi:hypothetical protein
LCLRDVRASLEELSHAIELALTARGHQRSPAILASLRDATSAPAMSTVEPPA